MLVLARKRSERIVIGKDIEVEVLQVGRNGVRLGISAPDDVRILRGELVDREAFTQADDSATTRWADEGISWPGEGWYAELALCATS